LKAAFGVGRVARISWIALLGKDQKVTNGIFPVFYFFKESRKLILAYGISEKEKLNKNWNIPLDTKTVARYFSQFGDVPHKYDLSYVYEVYNNLDLDFNKIESDLDNIIADYKKIMLPK
jgi:5-methylcytosine-specific restriction protein B